MSSNVVGIDAISCYVPKLYLSLTGEWSESRSALTLNGNANTFRKKMTKGIGAHKISVPDFHEDSVTLAANAVKRLIEQHGIDLSDVGSIIVATETAIDQSKPISSYILGMLEKHYQKNLSHLNCSQVQFACISATYALEYALNTLLSGTSDKKFHIVVSTDIAKYPLYSSGEATQGAGAVAMLIAKNPRLIEINPYTIGTCSVDSSDFYRPNFLKSAIVQGKQSIEVYCDCIQEALKSHLKRTSGEKKCFNDVDYFLFHLPFPKMAEYAAARIFGHFWRESGNLPSDILNMKTDSIAQEEVFLRRHKTFKTEFQNKVQPSLLLSEQIGNIYSGSLYLSLMSLIESSQRQSIDLAEKKLLLSSYGSGSCAKVFEARFASGINERYTQNITNDLKNLSDGGKRVEICVREYEQLHQHIDFEFTPDLSDTAEKIFQAIPIIDMPGHRVSVNQPKASIVPPKNEYYLSAIGEGVHLTTSDIGYRYYKYSEN